PPFGEERHMVCTLQNWLGLGSNPRLRLVLGNNGPKWDPFNIDYGASGNVPYSDNSSDQWVVWNVKDENDNYYGSITLNKSDGNQIAWQEYKGGDGYWLEGCTLPKPGDKTYQLKCTASIQPQSILPTG